MMGPGDWWGGVGGIDPPPFSSRSNAWKTGYKYRKTHKKRMEKFHAYFKLNVHYSWYFFYFFYLPSDPSLPRVLKMFCVISVHSIKHNDPILLIYSTFGVKQFAWCLNSKYFCFRFKDFRTRLIELAEVIYGLIFIAFNIIFIFDVS